jgi:hypothetical protein
MAMSSKTRWATAFLALASLSGAAVAEPKKQGPVTNAKEQGPVKDQMQMPALMDHPEVRVILYELEQASQKAVDAQPELKARMSADLKAATAQKTPEAREKAIETYTSKYEAEYGEALAKAGVDVMAYAKRIAKEGERLHNIEPIINDLGHSFLIEFRFLSPDRSDILPPEPSDIVVPYADYERYSNASCHGFSGGGVTDRASGFHVSTNGGVAAGCSSFARRTVTVPTDARVSTAMQVRANVNMNGTVAGVVGFGMCTFFAQVHLYGVSPGQGSHVLNTLVAPVLWGASWSRNESWRHAMTKADAGILEATYILDIGAAAGVLGGADCHGDLGDLETRVLVR